MSILTLRVLDVSPDGQCIAQSGGFGVIRLWNIADQKIAATLEGSPYNAITGIKFAPDGKFLLTTTQEERASIGTAYIWKLDGSKQPLRLTAIHGYLPPGPQLKFSRDGRRIAVADGGQAWVWDMDEVERNYGKQ